MDKLRYPIGQPQFKENYTSQDIKIAIGVLKNFPERLKEQLSKMSKADLSRQYRPEGWTGNQVVHHLADSHINAYIRTKFTLTQQPVTIMGYNEADWALTPDVDVVPIDASVQILEGLHRRWSGLLGALDEDYFESSYHHPENNREWKLKKVVHLYEWHCRHHLGHLKILSSK